MPKILKNILTPIVIAVILAFLLRKLVQDWSKIPFESLQFDVSLLAVSFCALILNFISYSMSWKAVMRTLDTPISFTQSIWMIATTQIGKYLPGKVWYMAGRVYVGKKANLDGKKLALSMVLETCLLLVTGSIVFLVTTVIAGNYELGWLLMSLTLMIAAIILLHPKVLAYVSNIVLRILKKPEIHLTLTYCQTFRISIYFFGLWIAQIVGFHFLASAIYPISFINIFNLASAYTLSWMTGFVVIFAPGGIGVREGVMTLLLSPILPLPLAIAISFIARIWISGFEILVFFVGLIIRRRTNSKPSS